MTSRRRVWSPSARRRASMTALLAFDCRKTRLSIRGYDS